MKTTSRNKSSGVTRGQLMSTTAPVDPFRQCCRHLQEKQNMICGYMVCDPITCHSKHMLGNLGLANHMGLRELALENNTVHRLKLS